MIHEPMKISVIWEVILIPSFSILYSAIISQLYFPVSGNTKGKFYKGKIYDYLQNQIWHLLSRFLLLVFLAETCQVNNPKNGNRKNATEVTLLKEKDQKRVPIYILSNTPTNVERKSEICLTNILFFWAKFAFSK